MSEPFLSEIRMLGFNWAPRGWAACDGQSIPIHQNQSLYSLLGTTYGGDGRINFNLPDLRGRVPVFGVGAIQQGAKAGAETVTIGVQEMAAHTHTVKATTNNGTGKDFTSNIFASGFDTRSQQQKPVNMYAPSDNLASFHPESVTHNGGGGAHNNMQPSNVLNFCIAMTGLFPSRN